MLRTDPKLAGVSRILRHALLSATWEVVPGDDSSEARRNADLVRDALGLDGHASHLASGSFENELSKMLPFLDVGFRVLEEVYYIGREGRAWLAGWGDTEPESVQEWRRGDDGQLAQVIQDRVAGSVREPEPIPAYKCLVLSHGRTGDNYEGVGLLRPCWYWWRLKTHVLDQISVGAERWANPTPHAIVDRQAGRELGYTDDEISEQIAAVEEYVSGYVSDGESYLLSQPAVKLEAFGAGAYDPAGMLSVVNQANQEMASAYTAHFVELGLGDVGSRAVGQVHWNAWRMSMVNVLDYIAQTLGGPSRPGGGTLARLIAFNFYPPGTTPAPAKLPRLVHRGLDVDGLADALGTLPSLVSAGLLTPTDDVERRIRRTIGSVVDAPESSRAADERLGVTALADAPDSDGGSGRPSTSPGESL